MHPNVTINYFIGYDPRDDLAFKVAERSMRAHTNRHVRVIPLKDHELRRWGVYWRPYEVRENGQIIDCGDGKPCSTQFSFTRFCVPELARMANIKEPVLFTDPDVLWRGDIGDLVAAWDKSKSVMCVPHDHRPKEDVKMDGLEQTKYFRKNWSSVMLIDSVSTTDLTLYKANNDTGAHLHALLWCPDERIGHLGHEWNHLVGYSEPNADAKLAHFTLGTPDMPGRERSEFAHEWLQYVELAELPPNMFGATDAALEWHASRRDELRKKHLYA